MIHFGLLNDIIHLNDFTDPKEAYFYFMKDGWIYLLNNNKRLCWVPVEYRAEFILYGKCVTLSSVEGQVVVLNFSDIITEPGYTDSLT